MDTTTGDINMGYECGFILRDKENVQREIYATSFCSFSALGRAVQNYYKTDDNDEYILNAECINHLLSIVEPIHNKLRLLSDNEIAYYDDHGYPATYNRLFYGNALWKNDCSHGYRIMRLYHTLCVLQEILEYSANRNMYDVVFYESY